jgi:hypothetical protein
MILNNKLKQLFSKYQSIIEIIKKLLKFEDKCYSGLAEA